MTLATHYANRQGFNVATLSLRHHWGVVDDGGEALGKTSTADFVEDIRQVMSNLFPSESFVIVGHSLGGLVAQCLLSHKKVKGCVLLASAPPKGILSVNLGLFLKTLKYLPAILRGKMCRVKRQDILELCFNGDTRTLANVEEIGGITNMESGLTCKERFFSLVGVNPPTNPSKPVLIMADPNDRACPLASQEKLAEFHHERLHVSRNPCHHMFHTTPQGALWVAEYMNAWATKHKFL